MKNRTLLIRTLTGAIFVALIVGSILLGRWWFAGIIFIATLYSLQEFFRMTLSKPSDHIHWDGLIYGGFAYGALSLITLLERPPIGLLLAALLLMVPLLFIITLLYPNSFRSFQTIAHTVLAVFYIAIPMALLNFLSDPFLIPVEKPSGFLLGFFSLVWINDTLAYLVGSYFGKRKLLERISPLKTWEGTLGGLIFTLLASVAASRILPGPGLLFWLIVGFLIPLSGTLGDLSESFIKRTFSVKDSGVLLPGHGGVLDRFDAVLFAAPVVFFFLLAFI